MQPHVLSKLQVFLKELKRVNDIHSFLGCSNWLINHYPWLSTDTLPIRKTMKKGVITWTSAASKAICTIKDMVLWLPPLKLPQAQIQLFVYSDASLFAWGGVLIEVNSLDQKFVFHFKNGNFTPTKSK